MERSWKLFLRVLRSYSIEEKVISIIVVGVVVFLGLQFFIDVLHLSSVSAKESSYIEGLINDKPTLLNPLFTQVREANHDISSLIFSGLVKYDPDQKKFVEDMATMKMSPEGTIYKFTLKPNVFWHDGFPVTAEDVYFTFHDLIQNPDLQNPILHVNFEGIEITQLDALTVQFKLSKPNSFFISNLNVGILPKHILANVAVTDLHLNNFNLKPIGSGPYKVDSPLEFFDDGKQRVILNVFDQYYGPKPQIQQIRFMIYPDEESLLKEKNSLNIIANVSASLLAQLKSTKRFEYSNYGLSQYKAVFFNTDKPLLQKDQVRLALLKAIDKKKLLAVLNNKKAVDTPLLDLNQSDWIYKPSLKEAQGSLFDAGFKLDNNIRKDKNGNPLKLNLLVQIYEENSPLSIETKFLTDFLKNSWSALGVEVDVQFVDNTVFQQRLASRDYDMVLAFQSLGYDLDTYAYWHSSQANSKGLNLSNYKSFAANQLIEKIRNTFDPIQKDERLKELAKILAKDVPAIFLFQPQYTFASDGKVKVGSLANMASASDRFTHMEKWCVGC